MRIELRDVSARRGSAQVVEGLSLTIEEGELVALLGPSGSGKSTLLAVLAGLHPAQGRVLFDGQDMAGVLPLERGLGMVFQDLALWPHLTVEGHLAFVLGSLGRARRTARIRELLEQLDLAPLAARRPAELSGGEAQRLALARALAPEPRALLLDEPLGALDRRLRARLLGLLGELHARSRTTTVLVTHDPDEALALADRVAVLQAGRLLQCGAPEEVYRRPASAAVAALTGPAALLPARRADGSAELPWTRARAEFASGVGADAIVVLRPEDVRVQAGGAGRVVAVRLSGGRWLAEVELAGQRLTGTAPGRLAPGTAVEVELCEPVWATRP